jgi:hypothetical protein
MVIVLVLLQVSDQAVDTSGQQSDLYLGRTRIVVVYVVDLDQLRLLGLAQCHAKLLSQACAADRRAGNSRGALFRTGPQYTARGIAAQRYGSRMVFL